MAPPPLRVVHILRRLDVGGMETVLVELLNRLPATTFSHQVICLTGCDPAFRRRVERSDVGFHALGQGEGHSWRSWWRVWRLLRELRPQVVHTLNLPALEMSLVARWAGVPVRVHGEHGRDSYDVRGENRKYRLWRRVMGRWVGCFVVVSRELGEWLTAVVGIPAAKVRWIGNGVDLERFHPASTGREPLPREGFAGTADLVLGSVGRLAPIKDQENLLRAFARLRELRPAAAGRLRLVVVGEGPERGRLEALAGELGLGGAVWFAGNREDVPELLRGFDLFVLSSRGEGTPLTVLEAQAAGLPVVATGVGGVPDLVTPGENGFLALPEDPRALAEAILPYLDAPELLRPHGAAGRHRVEREGGVAAMVDGYAALFLELGMRAEKG